MFLPLKTKSRTNQQPARQALRHLVSPFLQIRPKERMRIGVNALNVFDTLAIVKLASAAIPLSGLINAQVMNGRTVTGSVRFSF